MVANNPGVRPLEKQKMIRNMNDTKEIRRHWYNLGYANCMKKVNAGIESSSRGKPKCQKEGEPST